MPFLAAIAYYIGVAVTFGGVTGAAAITVGTFVLSTAATYGLGKLAQALTPKPNFGIGARGKEVTGRGANHPWQIVYGLQRIGGTVIFLHVAGTNSEFLYGVVVWCKGEIESIDNIYFGEELAITGTTPIAKYSGLITWENFTGTDTQAASTTLTTDIPAKWTSNHQGKGWAYSAFKLKFDPDKFSDFSLDNMRAELKGRKVLDPRTGTTAYSQNPILCARDFKTNTKYGQAVASTRMLDSILRSEANVCDESVDVKAGGTESRYKLNLTFNSLSEPKAVIDEMMKTCAGGPLRIGNKHAFLAGRWRPPHITITADDLRGPIEIDKVGRRTLANGVKGTYTETTNFQSTEYPAYKPAAAYAEDANVRLWLDLDLPGVSSASQCQRIAKIHLERSRRRLRIRLPLRSRAIDLQPGDSFALNYSRLVSVHNKTFIVEEIQEVHEQGDDHILGYDVVARMEDPAVYYWNAAADETTAPAVGSTTLPDPSSGTTAPGAFALANAGTRDEAPTTDPLTATDAGAAATISIASHTWRARGLGDKTHNSGTITGQGFNTLLYIYALDESLQGGGLTYEATATKHNPLSAGRRKFIGSIQTPRDGGPDTRGNGDGGSGVQVGALRILRPASRTVTTVSAGDVVGNPQNAHDGDETTYADVSSTGAVGTGTATLLLKDFPGSTERFASLKLRMRSEVVNAAGTPLRGRLRYSLNGGVSFTNIYSVTTNRALQIDEITLAVTQNTGQVQVEVETASNSADDVIQVNIYEAWIEGTI